MEVTAISIVTMKTTGKFTKLRKFFNDLTDRKYLNSLDAYGQKGVEALRNATPVDSGLTASSWTYEIVQTSNYTSISWFNTNTNKDINIAVILEYGHGTRNGGYVKGKKFISSAMAPVFDEIANEAWKEVASL